MSAPPALYAEMSDKVLVRIHTPGKQSVYAFGFYSHKNSRWIVIGYVDPLVMEWWPLPKKGTGEGA